MKSYTTNDLVDALSIAGLKPADMVLVHSSLFQLGRLSDVPLQEAPGQIVETILEYLGSKGTLVAPTFNFDFCNGATFDCQNTPSKGMGVLSEAVRTWPGSKRSRHPMQSFAAVGFHADQICAPDNRSSFSADGPVSVMLDLSGKLLLLGATMQAASIVHFAEERVGVPYRYWKEFSGLIRNGDVEIHETYKMYVRDLELNARLDLIKLDRWLDEAGLLASAPLGAGTLKSCTVRHFVDEAIQRLRDDPIALLSESHAQPS